MVQTGAPDYQDFANWTDSPLFNGSADTSLVGTAIGTFNVSQWAGIQCFFLNVTQNVLVTFNFYADAAKTIKIATRGCYVNANVGSNSTYAVPCFGSFVEIKCLSNGVHVGALQLTIVGSNRVGPAMATGQTVSLFSVVNTPVGATTAVTFNTSALFTGSAHMTMQWDVASWSVKLSFVDHLGGINPFFLYRDVVVNKTVIAAPIFIPPAPIQVELFNISAGAGNAICMIQQDGFRPTS